MGPDPSEKRRYRWPWLLLAAVILGIVLTALWVLGAVRKVRQIRESTREHAQIAPPQKTASGQDTSWTNGMIWIPPGRFLMGSEQGAPDERPAHSVSISGFWIDGTEVTNEEFARFIRATGYVTIAER